MSLTSELNKARRKRLEEEEKNSSQGNRPLYSSLDIAPGRTSQPDEDIAPVKPTTKTEERKWFQKGAFEDGYQFGDISKTIFGTAEDVTTDVQAGILGMGEKVVDAGAYLAGGIGKLFGADEFADKTKDFIAKDLYDENEVAKKWNSVTSPSSWINTLLNGKNEEETSVLGDKTDALVQSAGQLLGTVGLQAVGVPWFVTTGATSFGGEVEGAFNEGADYAAAGGSAAISAGAEILSEKLFGGIKFGGKALDDVWLQPLVSKISSKVGRALVNLGIDAAGEGFEEIFSQVCSNLGSALYKEESIDELLLSEKAMDEYLESFIGGAFLGGGISGAKAVNSIKTGRDYKSGLTENEQKVVDKELANRISETESDGKTLTSKEKAAIEEQVKKDLEKGYISTDTIESVLGGDTYKSYQDTITEEENAIKELEGLYEGAELEAAIKDIKDNSKRNELKEQLGKEVSDLAIKGKDTYLSESYNEAGRRKQAFTADSSKYDAKQQATIQKAVESGVLNDTRRTHEFVDMVAKISADKGVLFDFTNNKKLAETGFAIDGKDINGYVTSDGVTLNIDSNKSLNSIVGHEITHVLEGTELYDALQETIFEYAKTKGEYEGRLKNTRDLYKDVDGYKGVDGFKAIKREVVSDLVGDYLFTDADFINNLSTTKRNVFEKIYDEVKYLCKIATAGSKEARELEKVKHAFEQAYKAEGKAAEGTKYSVSDSDGKKLTAEQNEYFKNSKMRDDNGDLKVMYHGSQYAGFHTFDADFSDDGASLFFVDRNDVAASYSGTSETYTAPTFHTAEDFNKFFAEIGQTEYEVKEEMYGKNKWFVLYEDGSEIASSETAKMLYDEFRDWTGLGEGEANYKVYLNLTNPLEVDAQGRDWNRLMPPDGNTEEYRYIEVVDVGDVPGQVTIKYAMNSDGKPVTETVDIYTKFNEQTALEVSDMAPGQRIEFVPVKPATTREYAQYAKENGYDGVIFKNIVDNGGYGTGNEGASTVAIAFNSNQIKSVANEKPTSDADIRYSLSENAEMPKRHGAYNVYGEDVKLEKTPEAENITPTPEAVDNVAADALPDNFAPITEEEANAMQSENIESLTDADAPPEMDVPFYGESDAAEPDSPFDERDIKEVGKRNVKAYMYENPEVKPFFQEEANVMLGELKRSTKGERFYNDQLYYETNGEKGFYGTKRETSGAIAYLLDEFGYTYEQIEKGLNAIIEDNGKENNAVSKRIEFLLDERLRDGYTDFMDGTEIPSNQDYIKLLNEKQIQEYSEEARKKYFDASDNIAPMPETTETAAETAVSKEGEDIAPVAEQYEAIRPPKKKAEGNGEPRMKRADSNNNTPSGMEERSFIGTATGSDAVDGVITPDDIPDELRYYQVKSNKKSLEAANRIIENNTFEGARKYFNDRMLSDKITAEDVALGQRLIQEAAKAGNAKACLELTIDTAIMGTEYGQAIQAMSMIRRLSPEGQLRALVRIVERGKAKGDPAFDGVEVTEEITKTILDTVKEDGTFDQNELNAAVEDVKQKIADQMSVTKLDKINAWRYLAMLGNPKTHDRNIVSNVAMFGTRVVKNAVARTVEDVALHNKKPTLNTEAPETGKNAAPMREVMPAGTKVRAADRGNIGTIKSFNPQTGKYTVYFENEAGHNATVRLDAKILKPLKPIKKQRSGKTSDGNASGGEDIAPVNYRTKTWEQASDAVKAFAKETTKAEEANIKGDNKYSDEGSIKAKRRIFNNKIINKIDTFNKNAMEWEDAIFSKIAYKQTLQEYLTANGIKTKADIQNNPELIAQAKNYALEEARRATFRQDSFVAKKISEIERKNPIYGMVIGSTMPFKTTPINIAKTGLAYSPLGIARNIYDAVQVKKGNMDASEAIDHVAQTVTGTSLALIGYALASLGILNGAGSDDKEGKYDYQLGKQSYSFNFGGDSFSLSWLSPVAMPLFVGANAYESLVEQKEWDANVVFDTLAQTLDPLSEMSFLSSLDDVLSSYDSGVEKIMGMGESMVQNYVTQFVPTLSSQLAATFDDTKRSTKPSRNSGFTFGEETLNKVLYKIPGLRNTLEPTTDIWGNEAKQTENFFLRGFESFFSPANKRAGIYTAIDEEIKTLYGDTGDNGVIPNIPYNYVNYDGEKYEMSAEEYTAFKKNYGQTAYGLLEALFDTDTYREATSEERAEMVNKVYDYARDEARKEYFAGLGIDFTNAKADGEEYYKENPIKEAIEKDLPVDEYTFSVEYPEKYNFLKNNGVSYDDYKNGSEDFKEAYTWAFKNPEKFTLSKAVANNVVTYRKYASDLYDIKADKDENGKSINGSRKEKVIDYINNMDADYGEKIILFKSEYNADDTYNSEIIDYLNSRDDISYEEMATILKELGFTVHSDGRVTW